MPGGGRSGLTGEAGRPSWRRGHLSWVLTQNMWPSCGVREERARRAERSVLPSQGGTAEEGVQSERGTCGR